MPVMRMFLFHLFARGCLLCLPCTLHRGCVGHAELLFEEGLPVLLFAAGLTLFARMYFRDVLLLKRARTNT